MSMPYSDPSLEQLRATTPQAVLPADFEDFWSSSLDQARGLGGRAAFVPVASPFTDIGVWDVTFAGYAGHPIRGWMVAPREPAQRRVGMVWYPSYGSGRGAPHQYVAWAAAGISVLAVDVRGQGADWSGWAGATADPEGTGPSSGFLTRGIENRDDYYYRRVIVDCVRAIDALREFPGVAVDDVFAVGASHGGGLALAVAGLVPDLRGAIADVPFLCDFPRAARIFESGPYSEIARYLAVQRNQVQIFRTLAYFDAANFARFARVPLLASVGVRDGISPAATVFAAYNAYAGPKEIDVYEFNGHEGGAELRWAREQAFIAELTSKERNV